MKPIPPRGIKLPAAVVGRGAIPPSDGEEEQERQQDAVAASQRPRICLWGS